MLYLYIQICDIFSFFNIRRNQVKFIFKHHAEMFVSREHYIMRLINLIIEEYIELCYKQLELLN